VTIGDRATLEHQVWLKLVDNDAIVEIGCHTFLGAGTQIDVQESVEIGDHTLIAPGCFITDHDHGIAVEQRIDQQPCVVAPVRIGSDVWIGAKACILRGVSIGDGAIVAAASVVRHSVAPGTIVAGVPARQIGKRE
jgi:acetyltransferase-like isoleucine patch superfamily enzyme